MPRRLTHPSLLPAVPEQEVPRRPWASGSMAEMGMRTARHLTRTTAATQHRAAVVLEPSDPPTRNDGPTPCQPGEGGPAVVRGAEGQETRPVTPRRSSSPTAGPAQRPAVRLRPSVALEGDCRCGRRGHRMRQVGEGR
ncbi:hypothetical protein [Streptomyces sp. CFMR 7]|uniref:hypothetical protein n=1 Tax=Streptomyces sp. CFMR 7 TaxID=1649184 RepID=UPI0006AD3812|nr:hypothetical protein [Streptomyces sp. CFMR 7]ALC32354.1 hypothetical protein ABE83_34990 [Streptomyces sp. CFMR 7]